MKNELEIFKNEEFGEVRTVILDNEPYFVAKDIAIILGYKDPKNTVKNRCKRGRVSEIPHPQSKNKTLEVTVIPESDIYRLIMGSKLETAQKFESWVMDEVLPTIRKHGAYMTEQTLEQALTSPDFLIRLATQLKEEKEARKLAEQKYKIAEKKIEEQKPKVEFHDTVAVSENCVSFGKFAASFQNTHKSFGRNKIMDWCRDEGYLCSSYGLRNKPSQQMLESGYMQYKENVGERNGEVRVTYTPLLTGKGQIWLTKKLNRYLGINDDGRNLERY